MHARGWVAGDGRGTPVPRALRCALLRTSRGSLSFCDEQVQARVTASFGKMLQKNLRPRKIALLAVRLTPQPPSRALARSRADQGTPTPRLRARDGMWKPAGNGTVYVDLARLFSISLWRRGAAVLHPRPCGSVGSDWSLRIGANRQCLWQCGGSTWQGIGQSEARESPRTSDHRDTADLQFLWQCWQWCPPHNSDRWPRERKPGVVQ